MLLERPETILRALMIIAANGGRITVPEFAKAFFPRSKASPSGLLKAAAGQLGRLARGGYLTRISKGQYALADRGMCMLRKDQDPGPPRWPDPVPPPPPVVLVPAWNPWLYPRPWPGPR